MRRFLVLLLLTGILSFASVPVASACSVCFGDPNSSMVAGAKAGVAVLLGIVAIIVGAIVGIAFYWIRRAKLLQVQAALRGETLKL